MLITADNRPHPDCVARRGDGWSAHPLPTAAQGQGVADDRGRAAKAGAAPKPVVQSPFIDAAEDGAEGPDAIHLGFRSGSNALRRHLREAEVLGVHRVAFNLRFDLGLIDDALERLADRLPPVFS